jgi:hypothetical protein
MHELYDSKRKVLMIMAGALFFVAGGFWKTTISDLRRPYTPFGGRSCVALGGLGMFLNIRRLLRTGPQLVISEVDLDDDVKRGAT